MQAARRGGGGGGGGGEEEEGDAVPLEKDRVGLNDVGVFDADIYTGGGKSKFEGYHTSLAMDDDADEDDEVMGAPPVSCLSPVLVYSGNLEFLDKLGLEFWKNR